MLASTSAHFARLKQFIEVQLPAGFPMQIEVPLVHMIGAQVTFENIMCNERSVSGVNGVSRMCVAARARSHWVLQLPCNTCVLQLNLIRLPISMHAQLTKPSSTCRCRMRRRPVTTGSCAHSACGRCARACRAHAHRTGWCGPIDDDTSEYLLRSAIERSLGQTSGHEKVYVPVAKQAIKCVVVGDRDVGKASMSSHAQRAYSRPSMYRR